eukprot:Rmarinus@m.22638
MLFHTYRILFVPFALYVFRSSSCYFTSMSSILVLLYCCGILSFPLYLFFWGGWNHYCCCAPSADFGKHLFFYWRGSKKPCLPFPVFPFSLSLPYFTYLRFFFLRFILLQPFLLLCCTPSLCVKSFL